MPSSQLLRGGGLISSVSYLDYVCHALKGQATSVCLSRPPYLCGLGGWIQPRAANGLNSYSHAACVTTVQEKAGCLGFNVNSSINSTLQSFNIFSDSGVQFTAIHLDLNNASKVEFPKTQKRTSSLELYKEHSFNRSTAHILHGTDSMHLGMQTWPRQTEHQNGEEELL